MKLCWNYDGLDILYWPYNKQPTRLWPPSAVRIPEMILAFECLELERLCKGVWHGWS